MFRNLRLYRLQSPWPESEEALGARLAEDAFTPCGPFTEQTAGWEAPTGADSDPLARRVGGCDLMTLRLQSRLLPVAAINEVLPGRMAEFQGRMGREPSRKEKRQLRDEVYGELLPKALLKSQRLRGFHMASEQVVAVDAATPARAELFLDKLRTALGTLQVRPLTFRQPMVGLLTRTLLGEGARELRAGRECRMQDPASAKSSVQWLDMDLADGNAQKLIRDGLRLERLGVEFDDVLACVIDQDAVLRKIRLPGADAAEIGDEDPLARLDTDFVMLTGAVRRLLETLKKALGGYEV
ncbi:MAG: recombination-associated protein RdgC [Pseudomonadales bacterium]|nr:recombination-associated protein RdgC [Pseudomonadales bacterium]